MSYLEEMLQKECEARKAAMWIAHEEKERKAKEEARKIIEWLIDELRKEGLKEFYLRVISEEGENNENAKIILLKDLEEKTGVGYFSEEDTAIMEEAVYQIYNFFWESKKILIEYVTTEKCTIKVKINF